MKVSNPAPKNMVGVYAHGGVDMYAECCDVKLNPIVARIGNRYDTNATNLYLGIDEARRLYFALGQALQDYELTCAVGDNRLPAQDAPESGVYLDDAQHDIGGEG